MSCACGEGYFFLLFFAFLAGFLAFAGFLAAFFMAIGISSVFRSRSENGELHPIIRDSFHL